MATERASVGPTLYLQHKNRMWKLRARATAARAHAALVHERSAAQKLHGVEASSSQRGAAGDQLLDEQEKQRSHCRAQRCVSAWARVRARGVKRARAAAAQLRRVRCGRARTCDSAVHHLRRRRPRLGQALVGIRVRFCRKPGPPASAPPTAARTADLPRREAAERAANTHRWGRPSPQTQRPCAGSARFRGWGKSGAEACARTSAPAPRTPQRPRP